MLFILNRNGKVVGTLDNKGQQLGYKDDTLVEQLENGSSVYTFTTNSNTETSQFLTVQNMIVRKDSEGHFLLFTIENVQESHSGSNEIVIKTMGASIQLNNSIVPGFSGESAYSIENYYNNFLVGTAWEIGINEIPEKAQKLSWDGSSTILARLLSIANSFEVELRFRVDMKGNLLNKLKIDILRSRGTKTFKTFTYGKNITSISRETSIAELKTALRGVGSNVADVITTFKDTVYDDGEFRTIEGSDVLEAYKRNNDYGLPTGFKLSTGFIVGEFAYDTESSSELFNRTLNSLKKYSEPMVNYTVELDLLRAKLGYDQNLEVGDIISVVDEMFNPPLYLEARILEKTTSFTNKQNNKVVLGNYKTTKSDINKSLKELQDKIRVNEGVWASSPLVVEISSTEGFIFQNSVIDTYLDAKVTKDGVDVTQMFNSYDFSWVKYDEYGLIDSEWTFDHQNFGNNVQITSVDVSNKSSFEIRIDNDSNTLYSKVDIVDLRTTIASTTVPYDPKIGMQWLNINYEPPVLMLYTTNGWLNLSEVELTEAQLEYIKETVKDTISEDIEVVFNGKEDSWVVSPTEPVSPADKLVWVDNSVDPAVARKFNLETNNWIKMSADEAKEIFMSMQDSRTLTEVINTIIKNTSKNKITQTVIESSDFEKAISYKVDSSELSDYVHNEDVKQILTDADKNALARVEGLEISKYVQMTDFNQKADEIDFNIAASGGANMLKNSAGYSGTNFWTVEGEIYTIQTSDLQELDLNIAYRLNSTQSIKTYQNVRVTPNVYYSLNFYLKNLTNSNVGVKIYEEKDSGFEQLFYISANSLTSGFQNYRYTFKPSTTNIRIEIAADVNSNALITGLMLNLGTIPVTWSTHPTEVYGSNVSMDLQGVKVRNTATGGYTLMSADEFSIFGAVDGELERIATFTGETTELNKLEIEKELKMGTVSIISFNEENFRGWGIYKV